MRTLLSNLLTRSAVEDPDTLVLSGDHGYALFDEIRKARPSQFINVGIAEQGLVGLASGLACVGFHPIIYGLAAFVPMRVVEQIKLDLCFSRLPVLILGDGAGVVYSVLGASHQCGEDLACLRPLPSLRIYSPCDAEELRACYVEARAYLGPSYIRIGKSDRPAVNVKPLPSLRPYFVRRGGKVCLAVTGSMVSPGAAIAADLGLSCLSIPRIKPLDEELPAMLAVFERVIVIEEHSSAGGLASAILEQGARESPSAVLPLLHSISLADRFTELCGSYQFAMSEHALDDESLLQRVKALISRDSRRMSTA